MTPILVKICGVKTAEAAIDAARAGADFVGFVFAPKSPRAIAPELASEIVTEVKQACYEEGFALPKFTGLFVDAGEKLLAETAPFVSHFQFHGHEDAARVTEIRDAFGVEVLKAVGVSTKEDLDRIGALAEASDMMILDAKPPRGAEREGGNGVAFDWSLVSHYPSQTPFLLAGGLTPETVASAIAAGCGHTAFAGVDVSSGVEIRLGEKDRKLMQAFIAAAKRAGGA